MTGERWFHGGVAGLAPGDLLVPSPPHATDGCPICVARAQGRALTVGEYRRYLTALGAAALPALKALGDAPDAELIDPPSERQEVYITTSEEYATWYAARSGHGDVYEVEPLGALTPSSEDPFPSATVGKARVVRVVRRRVFLERRERRALMRDWEKRDRIRERQGVA